LIIYLILIECFGRNQNITGKVPQYENLTFRKKEKVQDFFKSIMDISGVILQLQSSGRKC
jgi:hypothetical protein